MQFILQPVTRRLGGISPGLQRIVSNISWLMFDRLLRMGCGLFVGVWVARYLGPSGFGDLSFALAIVALFGTVGVLGLDVIVLREVLNTPEDLHEILGTSLLLRGGAASVAILLILSAVHLLHLGNSSSLLLTAIVSLSLVFQPFDTIDAFFQSELRSRLTVVAKNSSFVLFAVVRVWLIHVRAPLWTFAAAYSGEMALGGIALMVAFAATGGRVAHLRFRAQRARRLLGQSWPVLLSSMAIMLYVRLDTVMLKAMQGDFAVGIYSAATRISEVWYFIPTAIVSSVSPAILAAKGTPVLDARMRQLFSMMTLAALTVGSVVALSSGWLVHLLYADAYREAGPVLAVHVWASVFVFLGVAQSPWDLSHDLLRLSLYRTVAGAVMNAVLNLYLIPRFGAMGAAVATVFSYAVSGVFANALHPQTRPVFAMQMRSFIPGRFWLR